MKHGQYDLSQAVKSLVKTMREENPQVVVGSRLSRAWARAVDQTVSSHTVAVFSIPESNGAEVVVYLDSSLWVTELTLQSEMLRLRLNMELMAIVEEEEGHQDQSSLSDAQRIEANERVKKLRFSLSKKTFTSVREPDTIQQQLECELGRYDVDPVPLTPEEEEELRSVVSQMGDPTLRQAAFDALKADKEFKKGLSAVGRTMGDKAL